MVYPVYSLYSMVTLSISNFERPLFKNFYHRTTVLRFVYEISAYYIYTCMNLFYVLGVLFIA